MTSPENAGKTATRHVRCPQCGGDAEWSPANPFRPFCSARCKQIDLGAWASEQYRVPASQPDEQRSFESTSPFSSRE
ncbi:MAG: DNA gyrase inhibitor YacG [Azoarcus sp.]|jgi:endogenous inhibitor of DNA gyrase (YacG/DUF329 family)|nr:DNA gyrase inhibitor YacG [Azoarcus sp.]